MKKISLFYILLIYEILQFGFLTKDVFAADIIKKRIYGFTRYETAIQISNIGWKNSDYAVLVSGEDFPDALCSAPLAKKLNNAPILLTQKYTLDVNVKEQLKKLEVKTVYIIGGIGVVSNDIEKTIEKLGMKVIRIAGADRYETSVNIAEQIGFNQQVVLASGENFADAISIAPIAAEKSMPILLTRADSLPNTVENYLSKQNISFAYIIGGAGAVSDAAIKNIKNTKRLWGASRYETNTAILNEFYNSISHTKIYVASGNNYADAVSGAALASANNSGIILTGNTLGNSGGNFLSSKMDNGLEIYIYGGTGAVSTTAVNQILQHVGYYSLVNAKKYKMGAKIVITNNGNNAARNIFITASLGKMSNSPYQKDETTYIDGSTINLNTDINGTCSFNVPYIDKGQILQYDLGKVCTNSGIIYNMDLFGSTNDYTEFSDYHKYLTAEPKIDSDNIIIRKKAAEVTLGEADLYKKAKMIFDFVNMYVTFDSSEGNKGALNALIKTKGVCEDYADLMVAMLRAENIPSRVVYGYNIDNDDIVLKGSNVSIFAHAWVEFYLPDYGWLFADPSINNTVNGIKVPADSYFANCPDSGYFVKSYTDASLLDAIYSAYSNITIDYVPYVTIIE